MEDSFNIEVTFEGTDYVFEAALATTGYTHRFTVIINGIEVCYEPDEERNYRAIVNSSNAHSIRELDKELIKIVGDKIQSS